MICNFTKPILSVATVLFFCGSAVSAVSGESMTENLPSEWDNIEQSKGSDCLNISGYYEHKGEPALTNKQQRRLSTFANFFSHKFEIIRRQDIDNIFIQQNGNSELRIVYRIGGDDVATQVISAHEGGLTCFSNKVVLKYNYDIGQTEHSHNSKGVITYELYRGIDGSLILKDHYVGAATDYYFFRSSDESLNWYRYKKYHTNVEIRDQVLH